MDFCSVTFIFIFLPASLVLYHLFKRVGLFAVAKLLLIAASLYFFYLFGWQCVVALLISAAVNFLFGRLLCLNISRAARKWLLALALAVNIGALFFFKYYNFFAANINTWLGTALAQSKLTAPLGISFYTFGQLSFIIDSYRGETKDVKPLDYALFSVFFPKLLEGPITQQSELIPQLSGMRKKTDWELMARGFYVFCIGMFKKVIMAGTLYAAAYFVPAEGALSWTDSLVVMLSYTFYIYFDFSGYCDMAVGVGELFGLELPQNFNMPYSALSIKDFWARWHMSLTGFFRKYLYFPLGGSRKGEFRACLNVFIVFIVSGIWHGAGLTFLLWGALHGLASVITRLLGKAWDSLGAAFRWLSTFVFVNLTWVIFRSDTVTAAFKFFERLFDLKSGTAVNPSLYSCFVLPESAQLQKWLGVEKLCASIPNFEMWFMLLGAALLSIALRSCHETYKPRLRKAILAAVCLLLSVISFWGGAVTYVYSSF